MKNRPRKTIRITRDGILFTTGLLGIVNEALLHTGPARGELVILYGAMIGLPVFLRKNGI